MKQQTCLVTGGSGFIGSHLVDVLLERNYKVLVIDNLITGTEKNILHHKQNENFSFIHRDVRDVLEIQGSIEYIFHLASPASVIDYQKYPEETALVNSVGTRNLLLIAKEKKSRFLFASTSEVYGDPKEHPQKETYWGNVNPIGVRSCYDESKRYGEMMTQLYYREYGVDTRIIRIFNTYGPRMRETDGRVISNFITQALKGDPITVYGKGTQTRSFCYVSDLVEGIWRVMESDSLRGDVVNLGNPEEYRIIDLAEKIKAMTNSSSEIICRDLPQDDPVVRRPDITKATRITGWKPTVSLNDGLQRTIEYYRKQS
ncbi:MAG: SDR family oxidoreductase [Patescibacteria group bacterium]|nr:SDR family oxidoreductase [Patescibacteria group bacterium]